MTTRPWSPGRDVVVDDPGRLTMRPFAYERPGTLAGVVALLAEHGPEARLLAGGTDLIIRLRDGTLQPRLVVDVKGVAELDNGIRDDGAEVRIGARTVMTELATDARIRRDFAALAEAAAVVGSSQIRNRATLAGNIANASPAADTLPALLVDDAVIDVSGPGGARSVPLDDLLVRSGVTTLQPGELITAVRVPRPLTPRGSVHVRRTRRRGHDLASVTVACSITPDGVTRLAFGSVGPRPVLAVDATGVLADMTATDRDRLARLETLFVDASPSPRSLRASPDYRLAMLHVLGLRAVTTAAARLAAASSDP